MSESPVSKRASLDRLRDISKQRSIRRPLQVEPQIRLVEREEYELVPPKIEWPIPN
jgi:hypothetical protein